MLQLDIILFQLRDLIFSTETVFKQFWTDSLQITGFEEGSVKVNYQFQTSNDEPISAEEMAMEIQQAVSEGNVQELGVKEGSVDVYRGKI